MNEVEWLVKAFVIRVSTIRLASSLVSMKLSHKILVTQLKRRDRKESKPLSEEQLLYPILLREKWKFSLGTKCGTYQEVTRNLFSVFAVHDCIPGSKFELNERSCKFIIKVETILTGSRQLDGTLYKASFNAIQFDTAKDRIAKLYHQIWGHIDKCYIRSKLVKPYLKEPIGNDIYDPCQFGKAHRFPFDTQVPVKVPRELMSDDVCGPFELSFRGHCYLIVINNHFSRFRFCFATREKSAVKNIKRKVLVEACNLGQHIKEFLSDNGIELYNKDVLSVFHEFSITQRLTKPSFKKEW